MEVDPELLIRPEVAGIGELRAPAEIETTRCFGRQRPHHQHQEAGRLLTHVDVLDENLQRCRLPPRPADLVQPRIGVGRLQHID
jgi:hypothetical protein